MSVKKLLQNGTIPVVVAVAATLGFMFELYSMELYVTFLGLGGFAGLAGLRSAIESSGNKTYFVAGGGALVSVLVGLGYVTPEQAATVMALLGMGALPTLKKGLDKTK